MRANLVWELSFFFNWQNECNEEMFFPALSQKVAETGNGQVQKNKIMMV